MITNDFRKNRAGFPRDELAKHQGQWVAFSADGRRIVAHAETIGMVEDQLAAMGIDGQTVVFEGVPGPDDDCYLGAGAEY
jgi:Family of unknown function (DUF5678)